MKLLIAICRSDIKKVTEKIRTFNTYHPDDIMSIRKEIFEYLRVKLHTNKERDFREAPFSEDQLHNLVSSVRDDATSRKMGLNFYIKHTFGYSDKEASHIIRTIFRSL